MNILSGHVTSIKQVDSLMLVSIDADGSLFCSLILENSSEQQIKPTDIVNVIFKETEVMIATKESLVSARNSFISNIINIEVGELLCNITFEFNGNEISSIITKESMYDLKCEVGDEFRWFVKTNEVTLQRV